MNEKEARAMLLERRAQLDKQEQISRDERAPVTLQQDSVGRLSRMDAMQQQAMALAVQQRRNIERARIDAALQRISEGEWGYCLTCGEAVAEARLQQDPAATQCVGCAAGNG